MENLLIIGCGDVARRALPELRRRYRVTALVRSPDPALDAVGVGQIACDLDDAASLAPRGRGAMLPRRFVCLSTSGVCGAGDGVPGIKETV